MQKNSSAFKRIAHRGASAEAPENTIPAIELAIQKYHVDWVEIDVRLTKDRVPLIFHDTNLDRTTNGSGPLRSRTLADIKKLDAGFLFEGDRKSEYPFRKRGVTVPTLEEVLSQFPDVPFCLEVKEKNSEVAPLVCEVVQRVKRSAPLIVGSFNTDVVRKLRQALPPPVESFLAKDEVIRTYLFFRLGLKKFSPQAPFASLPSSEGKFRLDDPAWIDFLHQNGVKVFYWTINERQEMEELIRRGADGIVTNYPDRLNEILSTKS